MSSKIKQPLLEWYELSNIDKVGDSAAIEGHMSRNSEEEKKSSSRAMSENNSGENYQTSQERDGVNGNDDTMQENEEEEPKKCNWVGWIIRIAVIVFLISLAIWAIVDSSRLTGIFEDFIDWMQDNPVLAPFVFIVVYVFATIFFLPGLILTLGAGFAFNEAYGNQGGKYS